MTCTGDTPLLRRSLRTRGSVATAAGSRGYRAVPMDTWRTASTRISSTAARTASHTGQIIGTQRWAPGGTLHAYRAGDSRTACGEPLSTLKRWPAKRFGWGTLARQRCRACLDVVRSSSR